MKLQHNLGGLESLGPVNTETRPFFEEWEKRIFGIHVAMMALSRHLTDALAKYELDKVSTRFKHDWTWGHLRRVAEALNPFDYFKYRYYERWLGGISSFFIERGYVSQSALEARVSEGHRTAVGAQAKPRHRRAGHPLLARRRLSQAPWRRAAFLARRSRARCPPCRTHAIARPLAQQDRHHRRHVRKLLRIFLLDRAGRPRRPHAGVSRRPHAGV
jgi:hypothetical protein